MTLGRPTPLNKNCGNYEDLAFMFKAEVAQQDGGLADEFGRLLQPDSPPLLMDGRFHERAPTRVGKCTTLSACSCKGTELTIMKSISAQNGLEGWRQLSVSYTSYTNGKANYKAHRRSSIGVSMRKRVPTQTRREGIDHQGVGKRIPRKSPALSSQQVLTESAPKAVSEHVRLNADKLDANRRLSSVQQTFLVMKAQVTKEEEAEDGWKR